MWQKRDMLIMSNNGAGHHRIKYGSQFISFDLEYKRRKTLEISVYPDLSVKVKAPIQKTFDEVINKVRNRAGWISEQQYFFSLYLPKQPPKQYKSGETHYYLGRQYRLKVNKSHDELVVLNRGILNVYTQDRNNLSQTKLLMEEWYRSRARDKFQERLKLCCDKVKKYRIRIPDFEIRKMSKRWGSFSKNGMMILNYHLIKAPSHCIDYVIMHELCHSKHFNHGKEFYKLLTQVMPDWERRKKRLEQVEL